MACEIIGFTQGSHGFKRVMPLINLSTLEETLKQHCSVDCNKKNTVTTLIHPTARSLKCIDMVFALGSDNWSGYIMKTYGHINDLAKIMSNILILDILSSIFTSEYMRSIQVNDANMELLSNRVQMLFIKWRLPDILMDLEDQFRLFLYWYIAIGVIPIRERQSKDVILKNKMDKISMYVYTYISALMCKKQYDIFPPSFKHEFILTSRNGGHLLATDYYGKPIKLLTFKPFSYDPASKHLSLLDQIIWQEIQLMHAEQISIQRMMIKQNQTTLVVSSEQDSKLISSCTGDRNKGENENKIMELLKNEVKKSLDSVSEDVQDQIVGMSPENKNVLNEVQYLRCQIQTNRSEKRPQIDCIQSANFYRPPANRAGILSDPLKDNQEVMQNTQMADALTVLDKECSMYKKLCKSLEADVKEYVAQNEKLHLLAKANCIELRYLKNINKEKDTKMLRKEKKIDVLHQQLDRMGKTMEKILQETTMSKEERDRYLDLYLSTCDKQTFSESYTHEDVLLAITDIFQTIPNRRRLDIETIDMLLERLHIVPVPIIPTIESKHSLDIYNSWMPEVWMSDKLTNTCSIGLQDKIIKNTPNILVSTPYMQVIDINPMIITSDESSTLNSNEIINGVSKKFMNVQFPQNGDVDKVRNTLKLKWDTNVHMLFCLSRQQYNLTGSELDPMLTIESIYKFVVPFIKELLWGISDFVHYDEYIDLILDNTQNQRTMSNTVKHFFLSKLKSDLEQNKEKSRMN